MDAIRTFASAVTTIKRATLKDFMGGGSEETQKTHNLIGTILGADGATFAKTFASWGTIVPRSKIELRHVRYIIAAAESGSFRRAAQDLGVEQSAISRRIRDVEDEIGAKLFRRHSAGVDLTEIGRRFLHQASPAHIRSVRHSNARGPTQRQSDISRSASSGH